MTHKVQAAGRSVAVAHGTRLSLALNANEVFVETPCGSRGYCRKCVVKVLSGASPPTPADMEQLTPPEIALGFRLSCQLEVESDLTIAIVPASMADVKKAAMGRMHGAVDIDPWAPLNETGRSVGLALDLGTTSIVGALLDLQTGEELAAQVMPNPQAVHGADLMSRLSYAIAAPNNGIELQTLALNAVGQMLGRLRSKAGVLPNEVVAATLVGNTAMHHLFLGLPVDNLALAPYVPSTLQPYRAQLTGLPPLYALPNIAGFVGADAVAAGLAAGIDQTEGTVMVVDIGTNGEILLRHNGIIYACSAPAGPAFEGGEISQGMRANPGAIETVMWDGREFEVGVIRGAEPRGICGSGLLDSVAALLDAGLLDWMGRLRAYGPAARRVGSGAMSVSLLPGVGLTQKDIRALQLAKGAIRSGIDLLLQVAGIGPQDLDSLLLAGAFGNYLRRESAIAVGLLPPLPVERVRPIGNAAAAGAKMVLLSDRARRRAEALAKAATHIDLARHPDFEEIFMDALNFPRRPE